MDIQYFKRKLEEEKTQLEKGLSKIAQRNPKDVDDWEAKAVDLNIMKSDKSEMADTVEEFANIFAIENEMEERLNNVKAALKRIEEGKYGICEKGCAIEEKRLEANPAAATCVKHANHI